MRAELEVHDGLHTARERHHVGVLNVAPVLAQMHRNAVGAAALGGGGGLHGVRFVGLARFAQGRDVIDVDVEAHEVLGCFLNATSHRNSHPPRRRRRLQPESPAQRAGPADGQRSSYAVHGRGQG